MKGELQRRQRCEAFLPFQSESHAAHNSVDCFDCQKVKARLK